MTQFGRAFNGGSYQQTPTGQALAGSHNRTDFPALASNPPSGLNAMHLKTSSSSARMVAMTRRGTCTNPIPSQGQQPGAQADNGRSSARSRGRTLRTGALARHRQPPRNHLDRASTSLCRDLGMEQLASEAQNSALGEHLAVAVHVAVIVLHQQPQDPRSATTTFRAT